MNSLSLCRWIGAYVIVLNGVALGAWHGVAGDLMSPEVVPWTNCLPVFQGVIPHIDDTVVVPTEQAEIISLED